MIDKFEGENEFLSNFYPAEIKHGGILYPTSEHFYVAMKIDKPQKIDDTHYSIAEFRKMISKIDNPGKAKRIGRKVILSNDWESRKLDVMNWVVREKFKIKHLRKLLISTGDEKLIEGNYWHDNFYGHCICDGCINKKKKNHLGKILMETRREIMGNKRNGLEQVLIGKNDFGLQRFLELKDGWLWGEGKSFKKELIDLLNNKLIYFYDDDLPKPNSFPLENGDVQLTWYVNDDDITLDINLESFNATLHHQNHKTNESVENELDLNTKEHWYFVNGYIRNIFC